MRGKPEEPLVIESSSTTGHQTIESSSTTDHQTIESHPYENPNVSEQQQQVIHEKAPEESPPAYIATRQPPPNPTPKVDINVPKSSLTNRKSQATPTTNNQNLGRHSASILCPTCDIAVNSRVQTSSTIITVLMAIVLFFLCFLLAFIPFFTSFWKKTTHYCPHCNRVLATVREFQ